MVGDAHTCDAAWVLHSTGSTRSCDGAKGLYQCMSTVGVGIELQVGWGQGVPVVNCCIRNQACSVH